jgi:large subunit ribosomal protein L28
LYKDANYGKIRRLPNQAFIIWQERTFKMAKCAHCGKTTVFGNAVSFSKRNTNRKFRPNLQKVTIFESGRKIQKTLCTKCIRTLAKTA